MENQKMMSFEISGVAIAFFLFVFLGVSPTFPTKHPLRIKTD